MIESDLVRHGVLEATNFPPPDRLGPADGLWQTADLVVWVCGLRRRRVNWRMNVGSGRGYYTTGLQASIEMFAVRSRLFG